VGTILTGHDVFVLTAGTTAVAESAALSYL
jgi:hypothetical protein